MGNPRYFIGNLPSLQFSMLAICCLSADTSNFYLSCGNGGVKKQNVKYFTN
ncbi:hypothetical protein PVAP13_8NG006300 [Panicum virgatum]|uniref:Uncharacterized protein n=1 Tax=Panicum virgatum TaxID=38727 RepID=A0A8T0PA33_PANVG|nr:hypothetical protein PVAP13_8NG006300 [Panicum virgatum]